MDQPYLEVADDNGTKQVPLAGKSLTIGRQAGNGLVIDDPMSSRQHALVEKTAWGWQLRDLNSRNGTRLGDARVTTAPLNNGDVFSIGKIHFTFVDPSSVAPIPLPPEEQWEEPQRRAPELSAKHAPPAGVGTGAAAQDDGADDAPAPAALAEIESVGGSLPFTERDIALVNARGQVVHANTAAGKRPAGKGVSDPTRMFRMILHSAFKARASDLHFEPRREDCVIRMRVDGTMVELVHVHANTGQRLMGIVKILADIDIAQKQIIQEGHFTAKLPSGGVGGGARDVDFRVSFTPSMFGQKLVIRVLDSAGAPQHLPDLGLPGWMFEQLRRLIRQDAGMLLVCGPTGSGKTTTLYSALRDIDISQRNVITIEDPVEYQLPGATQIPINEQQGNTFHTLLRSVLRQDPDVILVGEIRDRDTADTAMRAAMTGHLVFSTVHAKDTIGTIFRLLDLGVEPPLVASSLQVVLAQRLIRMLCPHCKMEKRPTPGQIRQLGKTVEGVPRIYVPGGCPKCYNTGYFGRRAIFELLRFTDPLRDAVLKNPSIAAFREALSTTLFESLQDVGLRLVLEGSTSLDEIERVTGSE